MQIVNRLFIDSVLIVLGMSIMRGHLQTFHNFACIQNAECMQKSLDLIKSACALINYLMTQGNTFFCNSNIACIVNSITIANCFIAL